MYLALIPAVHFFIIYVLAKKQKQFSSLKNNYAILYFDWLFVIFNALYLYSVSPSIRVILVSLVVMSGVSIYLNSQWSKIENPPAETQLFVSKNSLSLIGFVHLAFMIIQGTLALSFVLSYQLSILYFVGLGVLLLYMLCFIFTLLFVRKAHLRSKSEYPGLIFGAFVLLIRFFI